MITSLSHWGKEKYPQLQCCVIACNVRKNVRNDILSVCIQVFKPLVWNTVWVYFGLFLLSITVNKDTHRHAFPNTIILRNGNEKGKQSQTSLGQLGQPVNIPYRDITSQLLFHSGHVALCIKHCWETTVPTCKQVRLHNYSETIPASWYFQRWFLTFS